MIDDRREVSDIKPYAPPPLPVGFTVAVLLYQDLGC